MGSCFNHRCKTLSTANGCACVMADVSALASTDWRMARPKSLISGKEHQCDARTLRYVRPAGLLTLWRCPRIDSLANCCFLQDYPSPQPSSFHPSRFPPSRLDEYVNTLGEGGRRLESLVTGEMPSTKTNTLSPPTSALCHCLNLNALPPPR